MDTNTDVEAGGQTDDSGDTGDEADEGGADAETTPVDRPTNGERPPRKERRANKMREEREARANAERERDEYRQRIAAYDAQIADLRARDEERQRASQTQDKSAQAKTKITSLRNQAWAMLERSATAKTPDEATRYREEYQRLQDEAEDVRREMWAEQERERIKQEMRGQIPDVSMMEDKQYFSAKYSWLSTNLPARSAADGKFVELVQAGRPNNRQTLEEAVTWAAKMFRLGGNGHAPTEASRQRYMGTGQRDGEQDDGGSNGNISIDEVKNNLAYKRMALGAYPQLEPEQAYAKWAKDIGSKLRQGA